MAKSEQRVLNTKKAPALTRWLGVELEGPKNEVLNDYSAKRNVIDKDEGWKKKYRIPKE